ncbi:Oidioi.mRNA.OKI2018_I69.chr1.g1694.t1.cds [Oikopleura dioica]|uniref:Oidioi.mRNA.OKI2018_I69.chr1.g1694.t1.cds n=2 Tax=Oikopleura dioica TaxID=34765 RepID=A0ABN7SNQ1_OIKDI|nr:Oidioi.mRNA.OKI2018_I69.chr1.g1694.t1.cds [Oikopleura dioica]
MKLLSSFFLTTSAFHSTTFISTSATSTTSFSPTETSQPVSYCEFPKLKQGCDPDNGAVFGSSVKCKKKCNGFKQASKAKARVIRRKYGSVLYSVDFKGKTRLPAEEDYVGMVRFKISNCGEFVTDHHLHLQDLHVSFSDRQLDVYENQFIGHQAPKKERHESKESVFLQFSRRYKQRELKNENGDSLLMEVNFDEDQHDFEAVEECVTKANYYFMTKQIDEETNNEDYTKCMLHSLYKEPIDWEQTFELPPLSMPKTKTCSSPGSSSKIAGGQETKKGRYPWFAWSEKTGFDESENCGLTILTKYEDGSDDWLVTDSWCCFFGVSRFNIHIGAHDLEYPDNDEYIINPIEYRWGILSETRQCMVRVPNLIDNAPDSCAGGSCFEPACLSDVELEDGTSCYIAGLGDYDESMPEQATVLRDAVLIFLDGEFKSIDENDPAKTCLGDTGGGLICLVDDYPVLKGVLDYTGSSCAELNDFFSVSFVDANEMESFVLTPPPVTEPTETSTTDSSPLPTGPGIFPNATFEQPSWKNMTCETPLEPIESEPLTKIIGGTDVPIDAHPYYANFDFSCGGTLITMFEDGSHDFVLTAAHCCFGTNIDDALVLLGVSVIDRVEPCSLDLELQDFKIHENYDHFDFNSTDETGTPHDICLLKIPNVKESLINQYGPDGPETCASKISPACLPADHVADGSYCKVAGYGVGNEPSHLLNEVGVYTFSNEYCEATNMISFEPTTWETQFCAGIPDFDGDGQTDGGDTSFAFLNTLSM